MKTTPDWVSALCAIPRERFFDLMRQQGLALTYDDARLGSGFSEVLPTETDVRSRFSPRVPLRIPVVSAAMDTVTEHHLATELARLGGLGVIHKNMPVADQARQVARVKHAVHGMIRTPITVDPDAWVDEWLQECDAKGWSFRTFPVIDEHSGTILGIVTGQDFELAPPGERLRIKQIMTTNLATVPESATPREVIDKMRVTKKKVIPIADETGEFRGLYLFSDLRRTLEGAGDFNVDERGQLLVAAAVGVGPDARERAENLVEAGVNALVLDTAHGDTLAMAKLATEFRAKFPNVDIVAGNVSQPDSAWRLADAGAHAVKVGQGPGSICTTRKVAGIGRPQLSAVEACARAVSRHPGVTIIADGGINYSGDIALALAVGASCAMLGRMLAGCNEAPGELVSVDGKRYKRYRGMGSLAAMRVNAERYGQQGVAPSKLVPEGVAALVPWTGPLADKINELVGGVRSSLGYTGSRTIEEHFLGARFDWMTSAGGSESAPHDLAAITS